ncbi:hypothetical protein ABTZ78_17555 [Streptomyces bauhiniae]|uniref:hypothetical protein n=1 Tax=Streptomyces bauhiniae TaxID=2340725 RepID=UPI003318E521
MVIYVPVPPGHSAYSSMQQLRAQAAAREWTVFASITDQAALDDPLTECPGWRSVRRLVSSGTAGGIIVPRGSGVGRRIPGLHDWLRQRKASLAHLPVTQARPSRKSAL